METTYKFKVAQATEIDILRIVKESEGARAIEIDWLAGQKLWLLKESWLKRLPVGRFKFAGRPLDLGWGWKSQPNFNVGGGYQGWWAWQETSENLQAALNYEPFEIKVTTWK
jgi:hypothetical protein